MLILKGSLANAYVLAKIRIRQIILVFIGNTWPEVNYSAHMIVSKSLKKSICHKTCLYFLCSLRLNSDPLPRLPSDQSTSS